MLPSRARNRPLIANGVDPPTPAPEPVEGGLGGVPGGRARGDAGGCVIGLPRPSEHSHPPRHRNPPSVVIRHSEFQMIVSRRLRFSADRRAETVACLLRFGGRRADRSTETLDCLHRPVVVLGFASAVSWPLHSRVGRNDRSIFKRLFFINDASVRIGRCVCGRSAWLDAAHHQ